MHIDYMMYMNYYNTDGKHTQVYESQLHSTATDKLMIVTYKRPVEGTLKEKKDNVDYTIHMMIHTFTARSAH